MRGIFCGLILLFGAGCTHLESETAESAKDCSTSLVFAWPFLSPEALPYRGGSTQGTPVTLVTESSPEWLALQTDDLSKLERDRRAILAMAGNYRVSFQFTEVAGFVEGYEPSNPYFSWGTEQVRILENSARFISLQHSLVMWFQGEDGSVQGPMVMKHWRQDWRYQDTVLHEYLREGEHVRRAVAASAVAGAWTQAVFQVDDSPRYEVIGRWQHGDGLAIWHSEDCRRPLPRREFASRDDYNVLVGRHAITITPTGWVHEQHNRKLNHSGNAQTYLAQEIGVNRYERISEPDLAAGDASWETTAPYWAAVRATWADVQAKHARFKITAKVDGKKLYTRHFAFAAKLEAGQVDQAAAVAHARETVARYVTALPLQP
ncbi:MAG: hypothetical protein ACI8W8_001860 [Rhodothermales bacterium]|jgi:hypothetical protein